MGFIVMFSFVEIIYLIIFIHIRTFVTLPLLLIDFSQLVSPLIFIAFWGGVMRDLVRLI